MEQLLALDQQLFLFFNHLPHVWLTDVVAIYLSGIGTAGLVWIMVSFFLFLREEEKDHWFFLPVVLGAASSWFITELLLKPLIARPRPTLDMGAMIIGNTLKDFSFPSAHATFAWAFAVILAKSEPRAKWLFYLLAILISFSRIYLGKHYPLDVLGGAAIGVAIGLVVNEVASRIKPHAKRAKKRRAK